jgi:hypothetical protein
VLLEGGRVGGWVCEGKWVEKEVGKGELSALQHAVFRHGWLVAENQIATCEVGSIVQLVMIAWYSVPTKSLITLPSSKPDFHADMAATNSLPYLPPEL